MTGRQRIAPVRREYNRWVANQTLEDYALRFTAKSARRWSAPRVAQTAIGAISFLALEAIGGSITMSYGVTNTIAATVVAAVILFLTGVPIARYASRYGVDIDLLTRGAGFGYIGSTITSLIYATFTFILFAIEASIMSAALEVCFNIPLPVGYVISAVAVIPLVTHGMTRISRFQLITQPLWIGLNILPVGFIAWQDWHSFEIWRSFPGIGASVGGFDLLKFGAAASVILALMPQIGEQVDVLRFLPAGVRGKRWRLAALLAGPGWVILGAPKLLFGSFLAVLALRHGVPAGHASEPAQMYRVAFGYVIPWQDFVLLLTAAFVVVSQLKINVMNAYAGSLAWSNFFSRLTHSHPGRVVWLIFNVAIALVLMELGIYTALEKTLGLFSIVAVAWLGSIVADLVINKRLGLSPPGIEFKRAHLFDINPVGVGSMGIAGGLAILSATGVFGAAPQALAPFIALGVSLVAAPAIAWATKGRYYLARKPRTQWHQLKELRCTVCEHHFEPEDTAYCPAYSGPICSLCCSLDARCDDLCKPNARLKAQADTVVKAILPEWVTSRVSARIVQYLGLLAVFMAFITLVLVLIYFQVTAAAPLYGGIVARALIAAFFILLIVAGILAWFFVLAQESRHVAQEESTRQTTLLLREIEAHGRTDAALQKAKEVAEAANLAKSRYLVGLSHELRTPLNSVFGYAQILERDAAIPEPQQGRARVIRRSAEHLAGLIDGLLEISKIETGRLQLHRNEVPLDEFLSAIVEMFRPQAEAKGLTVRYIRPETMPAAVATDEKRLRQILVNLLSNALKFTDKGSISLRISFRSQVATITVEDTGVGISAEDQAKIFEPFVRGSGEHMRLVPGTGLGLTIVKMLAQLMGGDVTVKSAPGEGSAFEVRLMLATVNQPRPAPATRRRIAGYAGDRRVIMIVDDDEDQRELVRSLLEPLGFTVLAASNAEQALTMAGDLKPDLFILDISMPGMNGWDLARALREGEQRGVILMLSANVGETQPAPVEDVAHDDVMVKPFDVRRLLDRIAGLLGLTWTEETPAGASGRRAAPLRSPGPEHIAELLRLGRIGYVRGIEGKLDQLEADEKNRAFVAEIRRHVRAFDFRGYAATLEEIDRG
jgi:signal transduction histidine kinase/CheY-like chemotaxis protein/purine-cytosine permease-like protein